MWWGFLTLNPDQVTEIVRMQVQRLQASVDYAKLTASQAARSIILYIHTFGGAGTGNQFCKAV